MRRIVIVFIAFTFLTVSCSEDYLETLPTNQAPEQVIFQTVQGFQTIFDGVLRDMRTRHGYDDRFGVKSVDLVVDLMGEDLVVEKSSHFGVDYQYENHGAKGIRPAYVWTFYYRVIFNLNSIINNIDHATSGNEALRHNIKAQAYTLRAYSYFQLIQLFQYTYLGHENLPGIPVYTEKTTTGKARNSVSEVYQQINSDLDAAIQLFESSNLAQRHISNPTLNIAKGIRARVALVMNDWSKAAEMASEARQGYSIMSAEDYRTGFDNYKQQNWMWGLEVNSEQSTMYASWFSHVDRSIMGYSGYGISPKSVSSKLYNQMQEGDVRKILVNTSAVPGSYMPGKFTAKGDKEFAADLIMMRPEEMLLIEAEALARQNRENEARVLLKQLRDNRMPDPVNVEATGTALLQEILLERRIELWGEGFSLFDIKRLGIGIDRSNSNHKPTVAKIMSIEPGSSMFNFQIPQQEIDSNPNINEADQNP
jgi:starch-binding outer membrane protein, SusD/RagB family